MKLDSCLELKKNMVLLARDKVVRGLMERATTRLGIRAAGVPVTTVQATAGVAFGVAPHPGRRADYRLAVRVLGRGSAMSGSLLAALPTTRDEDLDLAYGVRFAPRAASRPLAAGGSCGHVKITAGTLGGFVEDEDRYYVLSNNHVLADSDRGKVGDPIVEPGPVDQRRGKPARTVARLSKFVPLTMAAPTAVDAAIAELDDSLDEFLPWYYRGIGEIKPRAIRDRYAVDRVTKLGRTTGVTRGRVSAYELDGVTIDYGTPNAPLLVTFDDQMEFVHDKPTTPFSQPGDSGSLILDRGSLRPVALLYGGGADANGIDRTLGHFVPTVLSALGVEFVR